ncbi:hypothetical protein CT19431_MP100096 [Cupriavidus taiwanensis]|nr:hypothetical protein CT19431_MP100096 [Cupriavidus taiwanensis]
MDVDGGQQHGGNDHCDAYGDTHRHDAPGDRSAERGRRKGQQQDEAEVNRQHDQRQRPAQPRAAVDQADKVGVVLDGFQLSRVHGVSFGAGGGWRLWVVAIVEFRSLRLECRWFAPLSRMRERGRGRGPALGKYDAASRRGYSGPLPHPSPARGRGEPCPAVGVKSSPVRSRRPAARA